MAESQCVITGGEFFSPLDGRFVHGDLHKIGGAYVFNAVCDEDGKPAWKYAQPSLGSLVIACRDGFYFERRGVVVFEEHNAEMNDAAWRYVKPEHRPRTQTAYHYGASR